MQGGFIDIHCHILPDLDDGPLDRAEARAMLCLAQHDGISAVVATPHILKGVYHNTKNTIADAIADLCDQSMGIQIYSGAEVRIGADLPGWIERDELPLINNRSFLLLELPPFVLPPIASLAHIICSLKNKQITPIISHPERNLPIRSDISVMKKLLSLGALFQVTAASIFARGETRKSVMEMIRRRYVHVVASDAHNARERPPVLSDAFWRIALDFSEKEAKRLFQENPLKIVMGEPIG